MLEQVKLTICGAGTLGGNLADNLGRLGMRDFTVVDRDVVEGKNSANQPYYRNQVGQPKVKALAELLYRAAETKVNGIYREFTVGNGDNLVKGANLVVDTFDNVAARSAVASICARNHIPCLHAGLSPSGYGEVVWDESYPMPGEADEEEDACLIPRLRSLSLLLVAAATQSLLGWVEKAEKTSYTVTLHDLTIAPLSRLPALQRR